MPKRSPVASMSVSCVAGGSFDMAGMSTTTRDVVALKALGDVDGDPARALDGMGSQQIPCEHQEVLAPVGPASTAQDSHMLDKTKLCRFHLKGRCDRGLQCTFAHGRQHLRPQPDLYRTQFCSDFVQSGSCRFGEACRYAHCVDEVRPADLVKPLKLPPTRRGRRRRGAATGDGGAVDASRSDDRVVHARNVCASEAQRLPSWEALRSPSSESWAGAGRCDGHIPHSNDGERRASESADSSLSGGLHSTGRLREFWQSPEAGTSEASLCLSGCTMAMCHEMSGSQTTASQATRITPVVRNTFIDLVEVPAARAAPCRAASAPPGRAAC